MFGAFFLVLKKNDEPKTVTNQGQDTLEIISFFKKNSKSSGVVENEFHMVQMIK